MFFLSAAIVRSQLLFRITQRNYRVCQRIRSMADSYTKPLQKQQIHSKTMRIIQLFVFTSQACTSQIALARARIQSLCAPNRSGVSLCLSGHTRVNLHARRMHPPRTTTRTPSKLARARVHTHTCRSMNICI